MKILILGFLLLLGSESFAKDKVCAPCLKASNLVANVEGSHIKADGLNAKTFDQQMKFVDDASDIVDGLLAQRQFKAEHAEALLRLLKTIRAYDIRMMIPETAIGPFAKLYGAKEKKKTVLMEKMDALVLAGTFTAEDKKNILVYMGVIQQPEETEE